MRITVFGLGTIGSNLIIQLLRQYPDFEFTGVDYDKVEERNIRIQAYYREQVRQYKAKAIQVIGQRYVRQFKYIPNTSKIESPILPPKGDDLYIDCFDNVKGRICLTPPGDFNILHLGFSPEYTAEFIWNRLYYDVPGEVNPVNADICALHDAVSFIHSFVNLAFAHIAEFIENRQRDKSFLITGKLKPPMYL